MRATRPRHISAPHYPRVHGCPTFVPDGTLSGWILLVAAASGRPVKELLSTWRYKISTIYDADFCRDVPPLAAMASMTFAEPVMLASAHGLSRTLLSRSTYACLTTRRNGVPLHRYCPACLDEDDTPYLRLRWRLAYEVVCERHRCLLLDRCPGCRRHIDFSGLLKQRLRVGPDVILALCPHCRGLLTGAPKVQPDQLLLGVLVGAQARLHRLVTSPYFRHPYAGTVASSTILHSYLRSYFTKSGQLRANAPYIGLDLRRIYANFYEAVEALFDSSPLVDCEKVPLTSARSL